MTTLTSVHADADTETREVAVVAYPLRSFTEVNRLCAALRGLPGIESVRIRGAGAGVLHLDIVEHGMMPLGTRLQASHQAEWRVVYATDHALEIALN
jgi:hypothetical protein